MLPDHNDMGTCAMCAKYQPIDHFRTYYNRKGGFYSTCKSCEKIESRYKYLLRKLKHNTVLSPGDHAELDKLNAMWGVLHSRGRYTASAWKSANCIRPVDEAITDILNGVDITIIQNAQKPMDLNELLEPDSDTTPKELLNWLTNDLATLDLDSLWDMYDGLNEQYRPIVDILSNGDYLYDEIYVKTLQTIKKRIEAYEEALEASK